MIIVAGCLFASKKLANQTQEVTMVNTFDWSIDHQAIWKALYMSYHNELLSCMGLKYSFLKLQLTGVELSEICCNSLTPT